MKLLRDRELNCFIIELFVSHTGLLSQASALTSIGYYRTSYQKLEGDSRPDIQYTVISASPFEKDTFENVSKYLDYCCH